MSLIVQKFGGSSVADAEGMKRVAARIVATKKAGNDVVVVVSSVAVGSKTKMSLRMMMTVRLDSLVVVVSAKSASHVEVVDVVAIEVETAIDKTVVVDEIAVTAEIGATEEIGVREESVLLKGERASLASQLSLIKKLGFTSESAQPKVFQVMR